jgi:hypothetical protein
MPDHRIIAIALNFVDGLRKDLTAGQYRTMLERNAARSNDGICHSHDFCDANMTMDMAFREVGVTPPADLDDRTHEFEAACVVWNAAWDHARRECLGGYSPD